MSANTDTHLKKTIEQVALVYERCYGYYNPSLLYKLLSFTVGDSKMNVPKNTGINVIVKSLDGTMICVVSYSHVEPCEKDPGKFKMKPIRRIKTNFDGSEEITYIPGGIQVALIKCKVQAKLNISYNDIILYDIDGIEVRDNITIKLSERDENFRHPMFMLIRPDNNNSACGTVTLYARIISKDGL